MDCFHHLCAKKMLSERHVVVCVHLPRAIPLSRVTLENLCTQERGLAQTCQALEFIVIVGFPRVHPTGIEFGRSTIIFPGSSFRGRFSSHCVSRGAEAMIRTLRIPVFPATMIWAPLLSKLTCLICRPKISPTRKPPSYNVMISTLSRGCSAFSAIFFTSSSVKSSSGRSR